MADWNRRAGPDPFPPPPAGSLFLDLRAMSPERIPAIISDIEHLQKDMSCIKRDVREIRDTLHRADGARKVLVYLIATALAAGAIVGSFLTHFSR